MAFRTPRIWLTAVFCLAFTRGAFGFSLLGPFAPWMTPDVGFIQDEAWDVGGPRNLGDEFRWNIPLLTYGFDENFKNFFGQPGIDAIEKGVAILNRISPASQIDLSLTPSETTRFHPTAQAAGVFDLKSTAVIYMVEALGLANSVRFTWLLNSTNIALRSNEGSGPYDVILQRNFDPMTFEPSSFVNSVRYTYYVGELPEPFFPQGNRDAGELAVDATGGSFRPPVSSFFPSLAMPGWREGNYFSALTRDDVGGIRYLLSSNNINVEPCLPTVRALGGGIDFVKIAARPGIEKITFQRFDPGGQPVTNFFEDVYFLEGRVHTQSLQRVIETPDILFTAANHPRQFDVPPLVRRTRPNFSHQNETGTGIFQPEIIISFHKLGDIFREPYWSDGTENVDYRWSSFDSRTLTPSPIFPVGPAYQSGRTLSVRTIQTQGGAAVEWKLRLIGGVQYAIESSADFKNWTTVTNITAAPIHTLTNAALSDTSAMFWRARRISGQ
jgi:hypothetical protein